MLDRTTKPARAPLTAAAPEQLRRLYRQPWRCRQAGYTRAVRDLGLTRRNGLGRDPRSTKDCDQRERSDDIGEEPRPVGHRDAKEEGDDDPENRRADRGRAGGAPEECRGSVRARRKHSAAA